MEELKTLEQKINDARGQILALEQSKLALNKQLEATQYAFTEAEKAKKEMEGMVSDLTDKKVTLTSVIDALNASRNDVSTEVATKLQELTKLRSTIELEAETKKKIKEELDNKENLLNKVSYDLSVREQVVIKSEADIQEKYLKIKQFKETI